MQYFRSLESHGLFFNKSENSRHKLSHLNLPIQQKKNSCMHSMPMSNICMRLHEKKQTEKGWQEALFAFLEKQM